GSASIPQHDREGRAGQRWRKCASLRRMRPTGRIYRRRRPPLPARKRRAKKVGVAFGRRLEGGIFDAPLAREPRRENLERALLHHSLPGADYLTVDNDDRSEHATAARQGLMLRRNDGA